MVRYRYVFCGCPSSLVPRWSGLNFFVMSDVAQCPCTLVVQFPAEVYRSSGESVVLPELLKSVDVPKVRCVQFIRNGLVRVTFTDAASCDAALSSGVAFRGDRLPVSPVSARSRLVYLRDLPAEVPVPFVKAALSPYGTVHDVTAMEHSGYPGLLNGTRLVKVTLENDIPSTVHIRGFDCRVWYQGQPQACAICRSYRHRVRECPLNGLCRRCHQAGHVARECREPRRSSTVHHESVLVDSSEVVESSLSVLVGPSAEEDDDDPDATFESADESELSSSISEGEEALASGDEAVIVEGSTVGDLPRLPVPVAESAVGSTPTLSPCSGTASSPLSVRSSVAELHLLSAKVSIPPVTESPVKSPVSKSSVAVSSAVVTPVVSSKVSVPSVTKSPVKSPAKSPVPSESPVKSSDVPKSSVKSAAAPRSSTVFVPQSITQYAKVFRDRESTCGVSRIDFGSFTMDIICDKFSFEYHRFIMYVHRDCARPEQSTFGDADVCPKSKRLRSGEPQKFPGQ